MTMNEVLQHAFMMPTVIFTVSMGFVVLYWAVSMMGIFSIEMFEGVLDAAESVDGFSESPGLLDRAGFGDLPRPITWSLTLFFGWIFSLAGSLVVPGFQDLVTKGLVFTVGVGFATLALGVGATLLAIQPLRRLIGTGDGTERNDLIGRICTVRTQRVDESFGQAEVDDGAMVIQVRAATPNAFHRGAKARILDYNSENESFGIESHDVDP